MEKPPTGAIGASCSGGATLGWARQAARIRAFAAARQPPLLPGLACHNLPGGCLPGLLSLGLTPAGRTSAYGESRKPFAYLSGGVAITGRVAKLSAAP